MSAESASIVEVCAVAAANTLIAARAIAGVTGTALGAPGAGVSAAAQRMDEGYERHQQRHAELAEWEAAAREVVDRNSRLAVLAARPGGIPGLPEPLLLGDQTLVELRSWCAATDAALRDAERELRALAASAVSVTLASVAGAAGTGLRDAADVLAAHRDALVTDQEVGTGQSQDPSRDPPGELIGELIEDCGRILDRLVVDVSAAARGEVLAVVERVRECRTTAERQGWLAELRVRVQEANETAARQREQARTAATMLQALGESTDSRATRLRAALAEVLAGRRELDAELHQKARLACERARVEQESGYVRDVLTRGLRQLGYQVDRRFGTFTGGGDRLRVVRDHWAEHAVSLVVDGDELRTMVVRTESGEGDDAQRLDAEREAQWCEDFEQLRTQLATEGLRIDVQRLTPPGARPVPLAGRRHRPPQRDRDQPRENPRENPGTNPGSTNRGERDR